MLQPSENTIFSSELVTAVAVRLWYVRNYLVRVRIVGVFPFLRAPKQPNLNQVRQQLGLDHPLPKVRPTHSVDCTNFT